MSPAMASHTEDPNTPPFGHGTPRADGSFGPGFAGPNGGLGGSGGSGRPGKRGPGSPYVDPACTADERTYGLFMHLIGLLSLASLPVPVAGLIGAGIMWKVKSDSSPYLDDHGRDAVNFQLSLLLYNIIFVVLIIPTFGLAAFGNVATGVLALVGCIRGAMASNRGEYYRYPMTMRFLKDA